MLRAKISIATLGGTLSMQRTTPGAGITPALGGEALLASIPELNDLAELQVESLGLLPSASMDFEFLLSVLSWAKRQVAQGAQGVVITQGTDTLEETATFFEYLWDLDQPLVLTGAMRGADQPGADGPANVLDACRVALSEDSTKRGVLVVMNAEIHQALAVRKTHSLAMQAFASPNLGPAGMIMEHRVHFASPASARKTVPWPLRTRQKVALLEAVLAADTTLVEQLVPLGYEGLVIAGFGAGHVSEPWSTALEAIAAQMPIIVSTRCGAGSTAFNTYGFKGGEIDLINKSLHMSGGLCPRKARILLWLLIGSDSAHELSTYL